MSAIKQFIIFFVPFLISIIDVSPYERKVNFQLNTLKCTDDPEMFNGTVNCFITSYPNGTQLATALYQFRKPCDDLWAHVVIYFKYGKTYRPWLINFNENVCAVFKGHVVPEIYSRIIYRVTERIAPDVIHKCPYVGEEGIKNINPDQVFAGIFPFVLPTGDYRILFRYHTTANKTFLEVMFGGHIEAINPNEAISMGTNAIPLLNEWLTTVIHKTNE